MLYPDRVPKVSALRLGSQQPVAQLIAQTDTDEQEGHFALEAMCLTKVRSPTVSYGDMLTALRTNTAVKALQNAEFQHPARA